MYRILAFIILVSTFSSFAQTIQNSCGTEKMSSKEKIRYQKALFDFKNQKGFEKNKSSKKMEEKYKIPVVFHFFYTGKRSGFDTGITYNNGRSSNEDLKCQVNSALQILNGNFNNSLENIYGTLYSNEVDKRFRDIRGKVNIEFVAATIDPYGNVLEVPGVNLLIDEGITTHTVPDPSISSYLWWGKNNKFYIDIMVFDSLFNSSGNRAAGISYLPTSDVIPRIYMNSRYLGGYYEAGTSSLGCSELGSFSFGNFVLAHEVGHYLGLQHTFYKGCDSINDGIDDTPSTTVNFGCNLDVLNSCGVYPNYENFMSYNRSCRKMFTQGQTDFMKYWLDLEKSDNNPFPRRNLWQPENLIATGVEPSDIIANFRSDITVCIGETVSFMDNSKGTPTFWKWEFEGGTPAVSIERNPEVTYDTPGVYNVKLTATDELRKRSHTVQKKNYVYVNKGLVNYLEVEKFDKQFPPLGWKITNSDNLYKWHRKINIGKGDNFCMAMNNSDNKKVGQKDYIQTPNYDFSNAFKSQMYFDLAYTKFDDSSPDILKLQVSKDCGVTWDDVYAKTHTELETYQVPTDLSNNWIPTENYHWRKEIIDLSTYDGESNVIIRFENTSGFGTKIMIDNFRVKLRGNDRPIANISYRQIGASICNNDNLVTAQFKDESTGVDTTSFWYFEGGTPSTSQERNVTVTYTSPGVYDVYLVSKNFYGEDKKTLKGAIKIKNPIKTGDIETFEGQFPPFGWVIHNPDNALTWEKRNDAGNGDRYCMIMNNADNPAGKIDEITLSDIDLSTGVSRLSFDVAYTRYDDNSEDVLEILGSLDCGNTWKVLFRKNHLELETAEVLTNDSNDWIPTNSTDWRTENISLDQYKDLSSDLLIKFKNISGFGTRIWIDNLKFYAKENNQKKVDYAKAPKLYPNPTQGIFTLDFSDYSDRESVTSIQLYDITGRLIEQQNFKEEAPVKTSFTNELKEAGTYFVKILGVHGTTILKILKQ
ncbi:M43 family zinc metalloprotease [Aquimarina sp. 2201CG1-2-11]|uniref:M43 family zinc metalloprotease n=1 Tax=Aquimarina discodermiae TaxID=3231043 RepID=UPI003463789C